MNFQIKDTLCLTFNVDKCAHEKLNGEHTVKLDLTKLTSDNVEQYLAQTLVIKLQSKLRSKNTTEAPETWVVPEPGKRIATDPATKIKKVKDLFNALTEDQKRAIAESMGFTYKPEMPEEEFADEVEDHDDGEPSPKVEVDEKDEA